MQEPSWKKSHMISSSFKTVLSLSIFIAGLSLSGPNAISAANAETKGPSGLPLPRFVSLKSQRVNMRVGPGRDYKVEWMYTKAGLPLEILQEYDNWRKVRDFEGEEGWILQSLLSGKRTAIVAPWKRDEKGTMVLLKNAPENKAAVVAHLEPGVVTKVSECENGWCEIEAGNVNGYALQEELWGVYPNEKFDN
jgi:SH3-like domain-containing protein